jgi:MYXO-CTERM domain-containing protein
MDFIEQWFGISPDGGDGSLELQWIVGIAIVVAAVALRRRIISWLSFRRSGRS